MKKATVIKKILFFFLMILFNTISFEYILNRANIDEYLTLILVFFVFLLNFIGFSIIILVNPKKKNK